MNDLDTRNELVPETTRPVPAWAQPPEAIAGESIAWEESADIVIIGAGHAGSCAARAAAEEGARVIVIEQQPEDKQWIIGVDIGTINSEFALSRGVPAYDPLDFQRDWQLRNLNKTNPYFAAYFARHGGETLDWLLEPVSEEIKSHIHLMQSPAPKNYPGYYGAFRSFSGTIEMKEPGFGLREIVKANHELARALGVEFYFGMTGEQLIKDGERVCGVVARDSDGKFVRFNASKGVLLAAGDFSKNEAMVRDLCPEVDNLTDGKGRIIGIGQDGKGIRMGLWAGARMDPGPIATTEGTRAGDAGAFLGTCFLRLNEYGMRYTDESFMGQVGSGSQGSRQPDGKLCAVFDSNWREELEYQMTEHGNIDMANTAFVRFLEEQMPKVVGTGAEGYEIQHSILPGPMRMYAAEDVSSLAAYMGYSGASRENFVRSVERYNTLAEKGVDEDFGKDSLFLHPIKKAPFFGFVAQKTTGFVLCTVTGLRVDNDQRALGDGFRPIPGLYATGNCSGGRFAVDYSASMPGVSIGMAITLGRAVGRHMACQ